MQTGNELQQRSQHVPPRGMRWPRLLLAIGVIAACVSVYAYNRVNTERQAYEKQARPLLDVLGRFVETIQTGVTFDKHTRLMNELHTAQAVFESHCAPEFKDTVSYRAMKRACANLKIADINWSRLDDAMHGRIRISGREANEFKDRWNNAYSEAIRAYQMAMNTIESGK